MQITALAKRARAEQGNQNGTIRGMGQAGIVITGTGAYVEKVTVNSSGGAGFVVAGSVVDSAATLNGSFGILAITVRGSFATDNHGNGIVLDGSGGVAIGDIASFNGGNGIQSPNGTVTSSTMVRNTGFGISAALQLRVRRVVPDGRWMVAGGRRNRGDAVSGTHDERRPSQGIRHRTIALESGS